MKKTLLLIASVALAMAACTNDVAEPSYGDFVKSGEVAFTATSVGTRTSMTPNANGGLDIAWVGGEDQIGIFASDETAPISANAAYSAVESGSYTAFQAEETAIQWGTGVHSFYAYYPYTEASDLHQTAVPASIPAVQEQAAAGDLAHIEPLAFMYASKEASKGAVVDFSFVNAFSVLEVKLCAAEGTVACDAVIFRATDEAEVVSASNIYVNLTNGALDYSSAEASNEVRVNLAEAVELNTETPASVYAMITPGHAGKTFQAVAVVAGKEVVLGEMAVPETGIPAGVKATLSLNVTAPEADPIDLSAAGTANCYIVNKANTTYKFKATVKGNGVAALGDDVVEIAPTKARLLWAMGAWTMAEGAQDSDWPRTPDNSKYALGDHNATQLISFESVTLEDGYVTFTTGETMPDGNAVIIATDDSDNVLWSWHIWALNGYDVAAEDKYVTTHGLNVYMMDRNIGATNDPSDVANPTIENWIGTRGMYFQWGRKDPFFGSIKHNGYAAKMALYAADGSYTTPYAIYGSEAAQTKQDVAGIPGWSGLRSSIDFATANPMTYISATSANCYAWIGTEASTLGTEAEWGKLWGNQEGAPQGGIKTIYDPCPVGYSIPAPGKFAFITSHNDDASAYYNHDVDWKYNTREKIFGDVATDGKYSPIATTMKVQPYGLNFYIHGAKTPAEVEAGAQNYGIEPEDKTVAYFPCTGCLSYSFGDQSYRDDGLVTAQTNAPAPVKGNADGGMTYFMSASYVKGDFYRWNRTSMSYGEQMGKAMPVRCFRENEAVVTPDVPETPAVVDLSAEGTANCYVVNAAATTYSFDATVMGNGAAGLTAGLAAAAGIESTTIAPASASIVWATGSADAPVVTDIELVDGKITFKTPATFVNGNAVVAALDAEGTILWSWHIWALEGYDVEANLVNVTTDAVEGDAFAASWIDRNIGAMNNNANGDMGAYGMYYQWGRKDPFAFADAVWFADGAVRTQPTIEDLGNEAVWTKAGTTTGTNLAEAVLDAIQYPQYYLKGLGNNHNWATQGELLANEAQTDWAALWGNPAANWWASTEALGSKSLFDPCPAGYRLPANAHYRFLSGIQADTYGNGSYGPKWPWRYNSVEATGIAVNSSTATWKDYTRGWNFYITDHHAGTEGDEASWDYYATGATWYFPAAGMTHYNGMMQHGGVDNANGKDRMALAVNQPVASDSKYGSRVDMHYNGTLGGIQYVYNVSNYCEGNACATPARCISE